MESIRPAVEELERVYKAFAPLFGREMPFAVITIQTRGRKNLLGWHSRGAWQNADPHKLAEIKLSAEDLKRPVEDIAECLLHEMVHHANYLDGIRGCTIRNYHNQKFKRRCEQIRLVCEEYPGRGWAQTSLSDELRVKVRAVNINADAFSLFRMTNKKAETKMKKWCCACTTIRAAVYVDATCNNCGSRFELREGKHRGCCCGHHAPAAF
jgi:hypothetical protein